MWVVLGLAGCVGPYPSKDGAGKDCAAPAELFEMVDSFADQYCDQLEICDPAAPCDPPPIAPDTGPCDFGGAAGTDCLCGAWSCDGTIVVPPDACRSICG